MKSAYELALEKSGGEIQELSGEQKNAMAEIDSRFKAKIAEAELATQEKLKTSVDPEAGDLIRQESAREIASFREKCEREKEKIRSGK